MDTAQCQKTKQKNYATSQMFGATRQDGGDCLKKVMFKLMFDGLENIVWV